jgi:hypothetical protein
MRLLQVKTKSATRTRFDKRIFKKKEFPTLLIGLLSMENYLNRTCHSIKYDFLNKMVENSDI